MAFKNDGIQVQEYMYDFAVDGGAFGSNIVLSAKASAKPIPVGAIIKGVTAHVITAIVGTSSTLSWGHSADPDGYSGTTIAEATLVQNYIENGWKTANSILWDDTNDVQKHVYVSTEALGSFVVLIGTANLTAGKVRFLVEYFYPSAQA